MATTVRVTIEMTVLPETSVAELREGAAAVRELLWKKDWTMTIADARIVVIPFCTPAHGGGKG